MSAAIKTETLTVLVADFCGAGAKPWAPPIRRTNVRVKRILLVRNEADLPQFEQLSHLLSGNVSKYFRAWLAFCMYVRSETRKSTFVTATSYLLSKRVQYSFKRICYNRQVKIFIFKVVHSSPHEEWLTRLLLSEWLAVGIHLVALGELAMGVKCQVLR